MATKTTARQRRETSLSRESIIKASIELLDANGEAGLTFRALSEKLATGPGAIYWHVADKNDLIAAACDAVVTPAITTPLGKKPTANVRALALTLFDLIDAHPWIGNALTLVPGQSPAVRITERLGSQLQLLGVPTAQQWVAASTLWNYILGIAGRNATNRQLASERNFDRAEFLSTVADLWSQLPADEYPFVRSIASKMRAHDDRADFLTGIDLILKGITANPPAR